MLDKKRIYISDANIDLISYALSKKGADNKQQIEKMKKVMRSAIFHELTEKQRYCLTQHYLHERKMKEIAAELNVAPSTVTRHIKRAKKRIARLEIYL